MDKPAATSQQFELCDLFCDPTLYSIATALRGPDSPHEGAANTKLITACVIRYLVGHSSARGAATINATSLSTTIQTYNGAFMVSPSNAIKFWNIRPIEQQKAIKEFLRSDSHYNLHFTAALSVLITMKCPEAYEYQKWFSTTVLTL